MNDFVQLIRGDGVATLIIDNPPVNIVDSDVLASLVSALDELEADPLCRAVILTGAGEKGFSAGASVQEHLPKQAPQMIEKMTILLERMHVTPLVTVAAVHGICLGGGAEVALACDFVIASENSKIGIPEITLGCYPPFAMVQLPGLIGKRKAKEMILTGRPVQAEEAERIGLINQVTSRDNLMKSATDFLLPILNNPPRIVALTLSRLRALEPFISSPGHRMMGQLFVSDLVSHPDYVEGITSFLEKREASWKGKRFCDGACKK